MAEIIWSETATSDVDEIANYIAYDNVAAAEKLVGKIFRHVEHLAKHPRLGPVVPEFPDSGYRQLSERPCRIFYKIVGDEIHIVRVIRTERLLRPSYFEES